SSSRCASRLASTISAISPKPSGTTAYTAAAGRAGTSGRLWPSVDSTSSQLATAIATSSTSSRKCTTLALIMRSRAGSMSVKVLTHTCSRSAIVTAADRKVKATSRIAATGSIHPMGAFSAYRAATPTGISMAINASEIAARNIEMLLAQQASFCICVTRAAVGSDGFDSQDQVLVLCAILLAHRRGFLAQHILALKFSHFHARVAHGLQGLPVGRLPQLALALLCFLCALLYGLLLLRSELVPGAPRHHQHVGHDQVFGQ